MKSSEPKPNLTIRNGIESFWKAKADTRDSPDKDKRGAPKTYCAVQIPIKASELSLPIDGKAAPPVFDSGPPDDRSGQRQ
jgi:hypothetical protein